jgi:putative transposase
MSESFVSTLEADLLNHRSFKTTSEAKMAVFEFMEGRLNPGRRHSAVGYTSDVNHESYD